MTQAKTVVRALREEPAAEPLIITRVEAIPVAIPLGKPVTMAGERIETAQNLIVRIEAAGGLTGWGEATAAPTMTGDLLPGMVEAVNSHLAPLVLGQNALRRAELAQRCAHALHGNGGAKSAVDLALADLVGRHFGVALAHLYGGPARETVLPMYLLGNPRVEDDIAEAQKQIKAGYTFFKLKIGIKHPAEEAAAVVEIRRKLGADITLCADANMGMTFQNARMFVERARDAGLLFLEQPLRDDDFEGMAALARVSPIPLNGDESIGSVASILALHRAGAIQGANIKTIKMGGVGATVHAMSVCAALGLNITLACKVAESSIAAAGLVQLGSIAPNLNWGISVSNHYLAEDLVETPVRIEHGVIQRPRGPGLGIDVKESQVNRFRVK
jgi:L-alanine-DL-glutamate epimerase-like enolase superfamily enzyme